MQGFIEREKLDGVIKNLKANNIKTVTTNGCFDILHLGHVRYLKKSKSCGDKLIVLLNSDASVRAIKGKGRPINSELERAEVLLALECVDYVVLFDENSPAALLETIKPDVHTKGADYTLDTLPEAPVILKNGGRVEFIELVEGKSTTNTISRKRHSYS